MRWIVLAATHGVMLAAGFALGIYLLPIITAPPSPDRAMLEESAASALYTAEFSRDLSGSDFLHWGEGTVSVAPDRITHRGSLAPGPDYKLYLVPEFVEDEAQFEAVREPGGPHRRHQDLRRVPGRCSAGGRHRSLYHRPGLVRDVRRVHQRCQIPLTARRLIEILIGAPGPGNVTGQI
jgi:hypothetical protein